MFWMLTVFVLQVDDAEEINDKIGNGNLGALFLALAKDLDVMEAKTPEDIYKSHLSETGGTGRGADGATVESAKQVTTLDLVWVFTLRCFKL